MKLFNKYLFLGIVFISATILFSCSKDDKGPAGKAHKGILKVTVSAGSSIETVSYGTDKGTVIASGLSGTSYTSPEFDIPANAEGAIGGAAGTGKDVDATIKAQLYIDGELKKEGTGSGTALIVTAQHLF